MRTYCFKCDQAHDPSCAATAVLSITDPAVLNIGRPHHFVRDYRAENVGLGSGVAESRRELTKSGYRDLFLPTAADMQSQADPTGQKGLREWAETHQPREGNKHPTYPEMDRTTFAVGAPTKKES